MPADQVHVEYFSAKDPVDAAGGFEVVLARSGRTVFVPEHSTILDALLAVGIDAAGIPASRVSVAPAKRKCWRAFPTIVTWC